MNVHKNARLTCHTRLHIVKRHEAGETPRSIASAIGVSPASVHKWLRCYRAEGLAGLHDHSSRPHRLRRTTPLELEARVEALRRSCLPCWKIAAQTGVSRATVARIGKRKGLSRLAALEPGPAVIRYEKATPGGMILIDIKKLGCIDGIGHRITGNRKGQSAPKSRKTGGKGWEYLHLAVDDHSRLANSEIFPDEKRKSSIQFLLNALRFLRSHGIKVYRVMTGNGTSLKSHRYRKALRLLGIKHKRTRPYTPKTNGKAQTSLREWAKLTKGSSRRSLLEWSAEGYARPYKSSQERHQMFMPFLTPLQLPSPSLRTQRANSYLASCRQ